MINATIEKFGYPATLLREFDHWLVLLRPTQVTLGSLVLAAKSDATAYADLPEAAFVEQRDAVRTIEAALEALIGYDKINYLMLMMVDPHVHFHVIPRYPYSKVWKNLKVDDTGWPGPPQLGAGVTLDSASIERLVNEWRPAFAHN